MSKGFEPIGDIFIGPRVLNMVVEVLKLEVIYISISGSRGYSFGHRNNVGRRGRVWGGVGPKFGTY